MNKTTTKSRPLQQKPHTRTKSAVKKRTKFAKTTTTTANRQLSQRKNTSLSTSYLGSHASYSTTHQQKSLTNNNNNTTLSILPGSSSPPPSNIFSIAKRAAQTTTKTPNTKKSDTTNKTDTNGTTDNTKNTNTDNDEPQSKNKLVQMYKQYGKLAVINLMGVYLIGLATFAVVPPLIPGYDALAALEWIDSKGYIPDFFHKIYDDIKPTHLGHLVQSNPEFYTNLLAAYFLNELFTIPRIGIVLSLTKYIGDKRNSREKELVKQQQDQ